jgi:hypothetical protein
MSIHPIRFRSLLPALASIGLASCGEGDSPARPTDHVVLPRDMVGCYAIYDERGRPASERLYFAPPKVRLEATPFSHRFHGGAVRDSTWLLTRLDAAGRPLPAHSGREPFLYWAADSASDNIRIMFSSGLSGSELTFDPRYAANDTLHGRAQEHWDFGPPFRTNAGRITAIRIPCLSAAGS